jgi:predicted Zn-dependent protease
MTEGMKRMRSQPAGLHARIVAAVLALAFVTVLAAGPAAARGLIRDAEIEATLARISYPLFRAAGLNPSRVNIYIVNSAEPNAFVAGGQNLFIHSGLIMRLDTLDQLRSIIAHEAGHIAGGHIARRDAALGGARGIAGLGVLAAIAAAAGGSPEAGLAIASASQQAAQRSALAHSRAEEASADQAGLRYMTAAGADPAAILEVLRLFQGQEALVSSRMDAYARTHPLWRERIALLEERIAALPPAGPPDPTDVYWHARMVAKFTGFMQSPGTTLRLYPPSDTSESAALARAVAYHREPSVARALAQVDALIAARPDDPYYHELRGQFLLESGRAVEAAQSYRRAVALAPNEPLILGGLGRALLNTNDPAAVPEAADALRRARTKDKADTGVLRDLALAEARLGNQGAAALATAERYALTGRFEDARHHAERAAALLPTGSPGWRQAQDVITMARRALN